MQSGNILWIYINIPPIWDIPLWMAYKKNPIHTIRYKITIKLALSQKDPEHMRRMSHAQILGSHESELEN